MAANRANIGWYIDNQIGGEDDRFTGKIYEKIITLTNAELKALNTTAKELIVAPGPGRFIELVSATLHLKAGTEALGEATYNLDIEYDDGTGSAVCTTIETTGFIEQTVDMLYFTTVTALADTTIVSSLAINKNLALLSNEGDFTDNASNDAVLKVKVSYRIHDFN